jgi:GDP-mannose 6-dehydrogenase
MARIGIFGLGYVGTVSLAVLANEGHELVGVDANPDKVALVSDGRSPVIEGGVEELLASALGTGAARATTNPRDAVASTDVSIVCVGTPSRADGSLDLTQVLTVCRQIGETLPQTQGRHLVVLRSTMLPGSTERAVIPELEAASGLRCGTDFDVCFNPEFLREGSSLHDFYHPPFTVIGSSDPGAAERAAALFTMVRADQVLVPIRVAETVKYASNAFHALKVAFANEIGAICKSGGTDATHVMDIFCRDRQLNVSPAYLRPGFAFGGSCLPKDLRALRSHARAHDVDVPLLEAVIVSNERHLDRAFRAVIATGHKKVGVLGLSFKAGTDDLRESPVVDLVERLLGKGFELAVYDGNVSLARLQGANRAYIEREIPHIASLLRQTAAEVVASSPVVIVGNGAKEFEAAIRLARPDQTVIDLVGAVRDSGTPATYSGLCW